VKARFRLPVAHTSYAVNVTKGRPICDGEAVQGYVNYTDRKISVHRNTSSDTMRSCLWHEFVHALMHEIGRPDLADDESFAEAVAQAIMRVRHEQPEI
jgi:hypothetical protein